MLTPRVLTYSPIFSGDTGPALPRPRSHDYTHAAPLDAEGLAQVSFTFWVSPQIVLLIDGERADAGVLWR